MRQKLTRKEKVEINKLYEKEKQRKGTKTAILVCCFLLIIPLFCLFMLCNQYKHRNDMIKSGDLETVTGTIEGPFELVRRSGRNRQGYEDIKFNLAEFPDKNFEVSNPDRFFSSRKIEKINEFIRKREKVTLKVYPSEMASQKLIYVYGIEFPPSVFLHYQDYNRNKRRNNASLPFKFIVIVLWIGYMFVAIIKGIRFLVIAKREDDLIYLE